MSKGYTAKLLRKFEDDGWIVRMENPMNHRQKIVKLTSDGIKKTDELISFMDAWENKITVDLTSDELKILKKLLFKIVLETENF